MISLTTGLFREEKLMKKVIPGLMD